MAIHQLERKGAIFRVHGLVRSKVLDTADIVRDAMLRPLKNLPYGSLSVEHKPFYNC